MKAFTSLALAAVASAINLESDENSQAHTQADSPTDYTLRSVDSLSEALSETIALINSRTTGAQDSDSGTEDETLLAQYNRNPEDDGTLDGGISYYNTFKMTDVFKGLIKRRHDYDNDDILDYNDLEEMAFE